MSTFFLFIDIIGPGTGRILATIGGLISLTSVIIGRQSLIRARRGEASARSRATIGLVLAVTGTLYSIVHLALTTGGFGTGKGRAGAIIAILLGLTGAVLSWMALVRARRIANR